MCDEIMTILCDTEWKGAHFKVGVYLCEGWTKSPSMWTDAA